MKDKNNLRPSKWMEAAKKIVNENNDIPVVLTNAEFIAYVNRRVPEDVRISVSYINQIISYNPETSTLPSTTEELFGTEFRDWWNDIRQDQELKLYKKMLMNGESSWQRFDNVLAKRFGKKWFKQDHLKLEADVNAKVDTTVRINFTEKK